MSLKNEIAEIFEEIAGILEFKGENKFKVGAYKNGANAIRRIQTDIEAIIADGSIADTKGIGKGLLSVINDYYSHRESSDLNELKKSIPSGLRDLFMIKGLGSKKIKVLFDELNISDLDSLEHACKNDKLKKIAGFSLKSQNNILAEIKRIKATASMLLLPTALKRGTSIIKSLNKLKFVQKIEITGELKRQNEVISKIELILLTSNYNQLLLELHKLFNFNKITNNSSYHLLQIDETDSTIINIFIIEDKNEYQKQLFLTTGSKEFLSKLNIPDKIGSETDVFSKPDFPYVAPPMREKQYFDAPIKLQTESNFTFNDFKGLLHFHTDSSDGINTLSEMITEAQHLQFKYAAVCDHSKSAYYANGLTEIRVLEQKKEITELNSTQPLQIFHGIESDIIKDGSLDYRDEFMKTFDFVTASIHSNFTMNEEEMTKRIVCAIESPFTDLLAHPTGRLLLRRKGYAINIKKVIDACSANDVAIEINSSPFRLDLDWRNIYYAREKGCKFAINPDAHSIKGISNIQFGIMIAQKAGLQKEELINSYSKKEFISFINRKIKRI